MIDRKEFTTELILRAHVREAIKIVQERRRRRPLEEQELRKVIRHLIKEADPAVSTDAVHRNTGINALEDLFKNTNLLTVFRQGYKSLTSKKEQRDSYKNHILNAVDSSLETEESRFVPPGGIPSMAEAVNISVEDELANNPAFIDVEKKEPTGEEEVESFAIEGQDKTGRNRAFTDFKDVEKNLITAFDDLDDPVDREMFQDYLLTNLKLYFERFEEELQANLAPPEIEIPNEAEIEADADVELDREEIVEWLASVGKKN